MVRFEFKFFSAQNLNSLIVLIICAAFKLIFLFEFKHMQNFEFSGSKIEFFNSIYSIDSNFKKITNYSNTSNNSSQKKLLNFSRQISNLIEYSANYNDSFSPNFCTQTKTQILMSN